MRLASKKAFVGHPLLMGIILMFGALSSAWAEVRSELRWTADSFLSPSYDTAGPSSAQFFGAAFSSSDLDDGLRVDLRGAYSSGSPLMSYMNVREFAYTTETGDKQSFSVGRKRERWSELDRRWNYGLIEPVFKWNPLAPESQGLTGLFWNAGQGNMRVSLFGSLFFVPEQGASFAIDSEGRFVRGNPWFRRPPDSIRIFSTTSQIEYNFDRPREADIVFQPSYGARFEFFNSDPVLWRVAGFYKPMNQLALGYTGVLDIPKDRGSVEIQPAVVYHQVLSSDLIYQAEIWRAGVSGVFDQPSTENPFSAEWTRPLYSKAMLGSVFVDWKLTPGLMLSTQYLKVNGGTIREEGQWASDERASITSRFPYQEATSVGLEYNRSMARARNLNLKTSYMWSTEDSFQLVRMEGRLDLTKDWSLQAELHLVEAQPLEAQSRNDIAEFRNNDRVAIGAGYAF